MGVQLDLAAIKGGSPEGVWLKAVFRFLLEGRYLAVVFQGDDVFLLARAIMYGARSEIITRGCVYGRHSRTAAEDYERSLIAVLQIRGPLPFGHPVRQKDVFKLGIEEHVKFPKCRQFLSSLIQILSPALRASKPLRSEASTISKYSTPL